MTIVSNNISMFRVFIYGVKNWQRSQNVSAADWLSLPAADLPAHTGDWQIVAKRGWGQEVGVKSCILHIFFFKLWLFYSYLVPKLSEK
jgi:hypothetical protein